MEHGLEPGGVDLLEHVGDGVVVVDGDWRITYANGEAERLLDRPPESVAGTDVREAFPASAERTFGRRFGGDDPDRAAVEFTEYFPEMDAWLDVRTVPSGEGLAVYLRDVTGRKRRERDLSARRTERETLARINDIVGSIIRSLVDATGRGEIEATVCEHIASSDLYEAAWIADRESSGGGIDRRVSAGGHDDLLETIVEADAGSTESPESAALRTGETRVVRQLATDESVPEPVRREAFARGLQSVIAVPLAYGDTVYGALGVYAARSDAFGEHEGTGFETLGETVGFAINATRQRNLLLSDTVVELRFEVTDPGAFFVSASSRLECTIALDGVVPLEAGSLLCYVRLEGAPVDGLLDAVETDPAIESGRVIHEGEDGSLLELAVEGASPVLALVGYGATVRSATFESGIGRIVAEVAPDGDVREITSGLAEAFPDSRLAAKRERERGVQTAREFRGAVDDRLTDHQRNALRTAYHAGYFESPRESTGEQVAASLGVTSPTFHHHLRAAQRKLLDDFFDGERPPAE